MSMENESSPRGLQWFLLIVAIIIVVVLFIMLTRGKDTKKVAIVDSPIPVTPELVISPAGPIDWVDTNVGESREIEYTVSSNVQVQITGVNVVVDGDTTDAAGISAVETCTNENTIINAGMPCYIRLKYQPEHSISITNVDVGIKWTAFDTGVETDDPSAITIVIGARELSKPAPAVESEPVYEPDPFFEPEPTYDFEQDVEDISPEFNFNDAQMPTYDWPQSTVAMTPVKPAFGSACSEFSFPGYNISGVHSGWIKPSGGAYYYYPFADVNCESPTGIYNPDTGYVMDISNPARRIGSDAEHIRLVIQDQLPNLGSRAVKNRGNRARQLTDAELTALVGQRQSAGGMAKVKLTPNEIQEQIYLGSGESDGVFSSMPYDRTFVLRQYKPIPATIVSDIQADRDMLAGGLPVRATVDRNVYSDNGRTVIIPTGTLMLGYVTGDLPGPYKAVGRMQIQWYQFIRPDGVEFNFTDSDKQPFSADSQGRKGVPGHGNTDYLQQFVMPMLTAIVPAAVNLIAPVSDAFVNQIDLDNNTVVQSGTVRSSELAKNEIITAWNNVATKLLVDMMDNTTPPFSIAAGTRITVFSPVDLFVTCGAPKTAGGKKCAIKEYPTGDKKKRGKIDQKLSTDKQTTEELIGQVRSMLVDSVKDKWCTKDSSGAWYARTDKASVTEMNDQGYSFTTVDFYCRSFGTYDAINNARQEALFQNQQQQGATLRSDTKTYNTQVLGLEYEADGETLKNPFKKETPATPQQQNTSVITCDGGANPDAYGCCPGETYTDMGDQGFNCCPNTGGDCFPPIVF
ncbi:MAG: TrbI/VirB10 family protein [Alphaproteobacteria bacterium]|nr:TrbI/VirB10 family protein [Alphaproteobacteria bacterium]